MAQSAKDYAKEQLGDLDLSHLNEERNILNSTYNTSKSSLENNFNNLINQINSNRADTRKNFNTGRATVAENSYTANRQNQADIASRVVGNSGLKTLGEVGNRMETGRQYSNLANEFYNSMSELQTTEDQGKSQYDIDLQTIQNTLDQGMANVATREAEAKNAYNMTLGQLAEAIQGRWDNNANAKAALEQAKQAAAQAHRDAVNAAKQNLASQKQQALTAIVNMTDKNGNLVSADTMISQIMSVFGVDREMAENVLIESGRMPAKSFSFSANKPYTPSNYRQQLTGGW